MNRNDKDYWLTEVDFKSIPAEEIVSEQIVKNPVVSVLMLAWNHAEFIDEAIESVVTQASDFPFELIIGEDCSPDETLSKCLAWQEKHPHAIRILTAQANVGMHNNFARMWHAANGEYIALCEGDDYWVDSTKLQQQKKWFDESPNGNLVGTFTDLIELDDQGHWAVKGRSAPLETRNTYSFIDLLQNYSFHFSSVMLRKNSVRFPRWFWEIYCVDRPLYLLAAENGTAGLLPTVTSRYRQHAGGIWSPRTQLAKAAASTELFHKLEQHFGEGYTETCRKTLTAILWSYMSEAIALKDWSAARRLYRQCLSVDFWTLIRAKPRAVPTVFLRIYFPNVYGVLTGRGLVESAT